MKIQVDNDIHIELLVPIFAARLFNLTNNNRSHLKKWLAWLDLVETFEDTQTFIDTAVHQHNNNEATTFAILYRGDLVGIAGFNHYDYQHKWGAIGYWLCASCTGKGLMTKVVQKLLEYGFVENRLNKIEIRCAKENHLSRAIPERLGFTYEATLRQCEWLYDQYVDHAVYSMLASEYKKR
ncbi:GNAT family N-acetyltransferase [Paraglaciecola arctica]|uniref:Ribosomal-protein-serine acetyltransferase n=1 Tax=Paraglaciecola arctica BSs20135 TaxID=493475 RepID=K6YUK4_9ALTE|nr:GNAT family protein [Paraglaciecola arctica]GAC20378.1 ribosomal-protein-serine acetyltransferase [Paraglaciecola arctica BSs20135]